MNGGPRRIAYHPALDGLRSTAVVAVVVFHAGVAQAQGGFLGVSLFFTLSGFLITRLLLAERSREGRIGLAAFWGRRVRRLAPAALLCVIAVLACSRWLVSPIEMRSLRGDVVAAAANVANWRFLTAGQSYASLFVGRPSPVLHFWSLAIEEQFYLVFPCVVAVLLALRRRWALPAGLAVLAAGSLAATLAASDHDLVYYGTHTRAGELLIGALLAWAVTLRPGLVESARRAKLVDVAAWAAGGAFVVLVVVTAQSEDWLYRGGFMGLALLWCPMILAATSSGTFAAVLGWSPLAAIGRRTYGIYVFHWPVFLLVTPTVLQMHGWVARLVQLLIIGALTEVSYRVVERPIRERRVLAAPATMRMTAMATVGSIIAVALLIPSAASSAHTRISMLDAPDAPVLFTPGSTAVHPLAMSVPPDDGTRPQAGPKLDAPVAPQPTRIASSSIPTSTDTPAPRLRISVIGSSLPVVQSLDRAAREVGGIRIVNDVRPGCTFIDFNDPWPVGASCPQPPAPAPDAAGPGAEVLVVALGLADHAAFTDRMNASRIFTADQQYAISEHLDHLGVSAFEQLASGSRRVIVIDSAPADDDFLTGVLAEAAVSTTTLSVHTVDEIDPAFMGGLTAPVEQPAALRVMVIGDSTSYGVAIGLAGSAENLEVLWAGKRNCPLIEMDASTLVGEETSSRECPNTHSGWPEAVASFRPDVVVAVASLPEEAPQRYIGDAYWSEPGDARYAEQHDAGMVALVDMAASSGAVIEVADAPRNAVTGTHGWTTDEAIAAWNAQVSRWDAQWSAVETIDYGGLVEAAETAAGHSLRPDGAHLDDASVTSIVGGSLAPMLVGHVSTLHAQLVATGCLVDGRLVVAACH